MNPPDKESASCSLDQHASKAQQDTMTPASFRKCSSMTLAISASNAKRMLEASRALNSSMKRLGNKHADLDSFSFNYSNLIAAVRETKDSLLCSFLDTMLAEIDTGVLSQEEVKLSLLLFLDMDKSSKLLSAFEILKKCGRGKDTGDAVSDANESRNIDQAEDAHEKPLPSLRRTQMKMLFQSFLTSISTCINFNDIGGHACENEEHPKSKSVKLDASDSPRNHQKIKMEEEELSPSNDENKENNAQAKSSEKRSQWHVRREIEEIAKYATDRLFEDIIQKQRGNESAKAESDEETTSIKFQNFGEWYNSGGYSLVPWLELLDLAKWDCAGRSAATAEATSRKNRHNLSSIKKKEPEPFQDKTASYDESKSMNSCMEGISLHSTSKPISPARQDMFLQSPAHPPPSKKNMASLSEVLISFNFSSSRKDYISITRENLLQLQHLVTITDFSLRSSSQIANVLLRRSKRTRIRVSYGANDMQQFSDKEMMILSSHDFGNCIRDLIPSETLRRLSSSEIDSLMNRFTCFFLCFSLMNATNGYNLATGYVNAKELAVGLSFLCNGNKSTKLASTFELIGNPNFAYLTQTSLLRYLRSYLTMLGAISLLSLSESTTRSTLKSLHSSSFRNEFQKIFDAVEYGSRWTFDHYLQNDRKKSSTSYQGDQKRRSKFFFEDFASWYTDGGFTIAPWLEFLDLRKFMSLLDDSDQGKLNTFGREKHSTSYNPSKTSSKAQSFNEHLSHSPMPPTKMSSNASEPDVLFTFPLANKKNLVVLREDAAYVRTVVDHLGLLHLSPDDVWGSLFSHVRKKSLAGTKKITKKGIVVDEKTFVSAVERVLPPKSKRKRSSSSTLASTPQETLVNFYQSFDLDQLDCVAVNQLMGGLTLLCGGKKSAKLSFAFSLFDANFQADAKGKRKSRKKEADILNTTLCGKELFHFFRSFLIVMFSCCKQSLDLSADAVGRYIADTANMVTDEVMKYQWRVRGVDRINFSHFGEWYNEGGFETAPWLELLDLNKWVLLDDKKAEKLMAEAEPMKVRVQKLQQKEAEANISLKKTPQKSPAPPCPPAPSDEDIHNDNFFEDFEMEGIGGDIGDMGFLFPDSNDKDCDDHLERSLGMMAATPSPYRTTVKEAEAKALKFQLFTNESNAYTISISPQRVQLLRHLVIKSNLCNITIKTACEKILEGDNAKQITRDRFNSAMNSIVGEKMKTQNALQDIFAAIFNAFDFNKLGKADATELACGLTVLCGGRKSDKLEYAFELLDKKKRGLVSRFQMVRYLQSFLLVLLNISSCTIGTTKAENILIDSEGRDATGSMALAKVICGASSWATEEIFKATPDYKKEIKEGTEHIDFDNFADWYTKGGYNRIAWLELLDLKKWVLSDD